MKSAQSRPRFPKPATIPIRVVHIITKLELGGAQLNTLYTVENLERLAFEPYLLSGDGGLLTPRAGNRGYFGIIRNLVRPIRPWHDIRAFFQIRRELKRLRPHVVHTHSSKAGIIGRMAAFSTGVPVIIHSVHGFSFSPRHSLWKRFFFKTAERIASRVTDHYVFVSREDGEAARRLGLVRSNYSLIRSGFPQEKFTSPRGDQQKIRDRYHIQADRFVCGTVAPFKPQKGLHHMIEVAARVLEKRRGIIFFIAGDGNLREQIERELKERGIHRHFRMPGFIQDMAPVMDMFDCGLSTALWEGLPQSIVQMRLKKIPVVVSDIAGHREIIHDGRNGFLVESGDYPEFARRIIYLMENPEKREAMGGYPDDFSQWDGDRMVQKQQDLYIKLVNSKEMSR